MVIQVVQDLPGLCSTYRVHQAKTQLNVVKRVSLRQYYINVCCPCGAIPPQILQYYNISNITYFTAPIQTLRQRN